MNTWKTIQLVIAAFGGVIGHFLGGVDGLLLTLIAFIIIDYVTGFMCAIVEKVLSSEVGFRGIFKKVVILMIVGVANLIDINVLGQGAVARTAVIFFYLSNEGVSILENAGRLGLPIPEKLKIILEQLKEKEQTLTVDSTFNLEESYHEAGIEKVEETDLPEGIDGIGAAYTPRLKAPTATDKNWLHTTKGGYNQCILIGGKACIPNCVGYVWGRWRELLGKTPKLCKGNANTFWTYKDGYKRSKYPRLGSVICWDDGVYGHVGIVEAYDQKTGEITVSQSAYGGLRFYITKVKPPYNFGRFTLQGFIHLPDSVALPKAGTATASAANAVKKTTRYKVVEPTGMNVRKAAKTTAVNVGYLSYGATFESSKQSGDWAYCDERKGWVCIKYGKENYLKKI